MNPIPAFLLLLASSACAQCPSICTQSYYPAPGQDAYAQLLSPTFYEADSGTHQIFASAYFAPPIVVPGGANVTDAATIFVLGAPNASGASNRSLYIYSGNSVVRDKLGVGAVTTPDGTLTAYGPGDSSYTAHFRTSNKPAPYGVWIEEAAGSAAGYPLLMVTGPGGTPMHFRIDSGGAVSFGEKFKRALLKAMEESK